MNEWFLSLMLCDAAQVADGKIYALGAGWSLCGPGPFVHAIAGKVSVPWDQTNRIHQLTAELVDEDSDVVTVGGPDSAVRIESQFEVGRPPGIPPGTPLDFPFAINLGPMELPAGRGYAWRISIDGEEVHRLQFRTRAAGA